jgi:hypothetical protein
MTGIKQKYQDLFFQTEQTVNRKKSGFRAARGMTLYSKNVFNLLEFNSQVPFGKGESAKLSSTFVFAESGPVLIDYAIQK